MKEMKRIRQRDGAIRWNLLRDSAEQHIIESAWELSGAGIRERPER